MIGERARRSPQRSCWFPVWQRGMKCLHSSARTCCLPACWATMVGCDFSGRVHFDLAAEKSLTAYDVAAGPNSLACAVIWWPIGFALTAAYFVFVSRPFAGKVSVQRDNQGFY